MNTRAKILTFTICFLLLWVAGSAIAAVNLTLNRAAINFPDADPDVTPSVPAAENPVTIRVRVTGNPAWWQLTVLASGDLISGSHTIAISNVSWTATPLPFIDGTLDKATPQLVARGEGNAPNLNGTVRFYFKNSWNYIVGNYSQVIVYTLTAP